MSQLHYLGTFSLHHHGITLTGRVVHRSRKQLCVQLLRPYGLIHGSLFMPSFMAQCGADLRGPLGIERRDAMLRLLHDDAVEAAGQLPLMLQLLRLQPDGGATFIAAMADRLACTGPDPTQLLPWNHPARFYREVQNLRQQARLSTPLPFNLPGDDDELHWQLLLLAYHGLAGRWEGEGWLGDDLGMNEEP